MPCQVGPTQASCMQLAGCQDEGHPSGAPFCAGCTTGSSDCHILLQTGDKQEALTGLQPCQVCMILQLESAHRVWRGALPSLHDPPHHGLKRLSKSLWLGLHALAATLDAGPAPTQQAQAWADQLGLWSVPSAVRNGSRRATLPLRPGDASHSQIRAQPQSRLPTELAGGVLRVPCGAGGRSAARTPACATGHGCTHTWPAPPASRCHKLVRWPDCASPS